MKDKKCKYFKLRVPKPHGFVTQASVSEKVWENILRDFQHCDDIDFAYPTVRRFFNQDEGKTGSKGLALPVSTQEEVN